MPFQEITHNNRVKSDIFLPVSAEMKKKQSSYFAEERLCDFLKPRVALAGAGQVVQMI